MNDLSTKYSVKHSVAKANSNPHRLAISSCKHFLVVSIWNQALAGISCPKYKLEKEVGEE